MSPLFLLAATSLAAVLGYGLTPVATWLARKTGAIDLPGPRKIHQSPIPRLGGVAVMAAITMTVGVVLATGLVDAMPRFLLGLSLSLLPVFVVSLIDDIRSVPAWVKFLIHGLSAAVAISFGFTLDQTISVLGNDVFIGQYSVVISWLWIVGVTNAFNLTDGLDGLSAGLALISAASLAVVALVIVDAPQAVFSLIIVGALVGFLPHNTYPARIFFGDAGAASIGFLLACLGLSGSARLSTGMAVLVPIVVMGVPIADALTSIARRALGRLLGSHSGVFVPDQAHIHHRLLHKGLDHQRAVLLLYGVGLTFALTGVLSMFFTSGRAALVVVTLIVAAGLAIRALDYDEFAIIRNGLVLRMYEVPALRTGAFRVFMDMALVALSVYLAFALKFDEWHLTGSREIALNLVVIQLPVTLALFLSFGLYRRSWRQSNVHDLLRTLAAITTSAVAGLLIVRLTVADGPTVALFIIYAMVLAALVLAVRMSFRILLYWKGREKEGADRVLIFCADAQGAVALQELFWSRSEHVQPIGFIDNDPKNVGRLVNGFKVHGNVRSLQLIAHNLGVSGLVLASAIAPDQLELLAAQCAKAGIWLKQFQVQLHTLPTDDANQSEDHDDRMHFRPV